MEQQQLREMIVRELPALMQNNEAFQTIVFNITRRRFADKTETENRFDRMMNMLQQHMDLDTERWETERRDQQKKWDAQEKKWDAQEKKWEENQKAIKALYEKHESSIGALGSRWGLHAEASFRNALKGILEDVSDIEVININEYDDEGTVFGKPDQVEVDIIIKNGLLLVCEIESSMSKSDMYTFERKVRFYENRHKAKADRMIAISPMVPDNAKTVAKKLGVEVYSYTGDLCL